jgi:TatD DNase family protein
MLKNYINIHCHSAEPDVLVSVVNQLIDPEGKLQPPKVNFLYKSVGLHPWYLNESTFENQIVLLEELLKSGEYFAIGECGLDRLKGPAMPIQKRAFLAQVELAQRFSLPMILHLVKTHADILHLKKQIPDHLKLIIHGFTGNVIQMEQLTEAGFYLSFGEKLLKSNEKLEKAFRKCPLNQLFLETDTSNISIASVYQKASSLKGIELDKLVSQIKINFDKIK